MSNHWNGQTLQGHPQPGYGPGQPPPPPYGSRSYGEAPGYRPPIEPQRPTATMAPPKRSNRAALIVVGVIAAAALAGGGAYVALGGTLPFSGGGTGAPAVTATGSGRADPAAAPIGAAGNTAVPACPFTAAQVSELVGQPMAVADAGDCQFGDGNGVAQFGIITASASATEVTYDYSRDRATKVYDDVADLDSGAKGYLAYKDIEAEAVVINAKGGFTITMSSFERLGGSAYEPVLRKVVDALPR